jgi:hypothetical protein
MPRRRSIPHSLALCLFAVMLAGGVALVQTDSAPLPGLALLGVGAAGAFVATGHGPFGDGGGSDGGGDTGADGGGDGGGGE